MASNHKYLDVSALCLQYASLPQTTVNIHIGILSVYICRFTDNLCYASKKKNQLFDIPQTTIICLH